MILSVSRRTDIPCCFAPWFMHRIRQGFVLVRNPINPGQVSRIPLSPDLVDCIVFWTKNPAPLMPYLKELNTRGYTYCFQFTLTGYGKVLEQNLPDPSVIIATFQALAKQIGKAGVLWRYDPVLFSTGLDLAFHKHNFAKLCQALHPYTNQVTLSMVNLYKKIKSPLVQGVPPQQEAALWDFLGQTATAYGLTPKSCCAHPSTPQIQQGSCIDKAILEKICACPLSIKPDKNQRKSCGCMESVDIGAYFTCQNHCLYCYAGHGRTAHNPTSPLLAGTLSPTDTLHQRQLHSHKLGQTTLFDCV